MGSSSSFKELARRWSRRAAVPGMLERREGTIINVAGMIAFSGPAGPEQLPGCVVDTGRSPIWSLDAAAPRRARRMGIKVQVVCPAWWPPSSTSARGSTSSAVPRMSPADVVTASLRGLEHGEVVCAPGVERADLLQAVFDADLAAFGAQRPELAHRYRSDAAADQ